MKNVIVLMILTACACNQESTQRNDDLAGFVEVENNDVPTEYTPKPDIAHVVITVEPPDLAQPVDLSTFSCPSTGTCCGC